LTFRNPVRYCDVAESCVVIYNYDQDPHTLAIADSGGQQISDTVQVPAGHTGTAVSLTVTLPPGTYVLFCTLPQHAADGMKTTIVVK
jgi:plastocyanin